MSLFPLINNSRIAVVGAGPAGSLFAISLLKEASKRGLELKLHLFDKKDFTNLGIAGCNMCAGVLSYTFVEDLERLLGKPIPQEVIRQTIHGYTLNIRGNEATVIQPLEIPTVFRSAGPELKVSTKGLDAFLLEEAIKWGANFVPKKVVEISRGRIVYLQGDQKIFESYDLVVGAFGVNSAIRVLGYRPPKTWQLCQAELVYPHDSHLMCIRPDIYVSSRRRKGILFTSLTPKGPYFTITVVGPKITFEDLKEELEALKTHIPPGWRIICHCLPHTPVTIAKRPYDEQLVIVGDACCSRYLKNGLGSALITAELAAKAVLEHGTSKKALKKYYYKWCKRRFGLDTTIGKFIFQAYSIIVRLRPLGNAHIKLLKDEQGGGTPLLSDAVWHIFTGDKPYLTILKKLLSPRLQMALWRTLLTRQAPALPPKSITNSTRIAVIGAGPSGTSFAIKLLKEARTRNILPEVIIFEGKDYLKHFNQCVGVLSPPLTKILRQELDIILPNQLIKKTIKAYKFYADNEALILQMGDTPEPTYTVRRVKFDEFMLNEARRLGAKIIDSRVNHIEFVRSRDEVRIYSEIGFSKVDAVVVASGLDFSLLHDLEEATPRHARYRHPRRILKTLVMKIHGGVTFVDTRVGDIIHAFLTSSIKGVLFGAVTPKSDHVIVNIASKNPSSLDMDNFLNLPQVRNLLPPFKQGELEYYKGQFPSSPCEHAWGDRYVVVGDATGWVRPFKGKGINTAVITGACAARKMIEHGISKMAFEKYARECATFTEDYKWGLLAEYLCRLGLKAKFFDRVIQIARNDARLRQILHDSISGERPYREIFLSWKNLPVFVKLAWEFVRSSILYLSADA